MQGEMNGGLMIGPAEPVAIDLGEVERLSREVGKALRDRPDFFRMPDNTLSIEGYVGIKVVTGRDHAAGVVGYSVESLDPRRPHPSFFTTDMEEGIVRMFRLWIEEICRETIENCRRKPRS